MARNDAGQVVVAPDSPSDVMAEVGEVLSDVEATYSEREREAGEVVASKKYLEDHQCPICGSDEVRAREAIESVDLDNAYCKNECDKCGATWTEEWSLKAIYNIKKPS